MFGRQPLPRPGTDEARALEKRIAASTTTERHDIARLHGVSYGGLLNWRTRCKRHSLPQIQPPRDSSLSEHFRVCRELDGLIEPHFRTQAELSVRIETQLPVAVVHTADWHMGESGCDYDQLEADLAVMSTEPGLYVALGGDAYSNIIQPSKIGSSHNQAPIAVQKAMYVLAVKQLQDSGHLLFAGTGNHPYWTALATGEDWDLELARRLRIVYTKHGALVNIVVGDMLYPEFWEHKGKYGSSFNQTHGPKQSQRVFHPNARIVVREHQHIGDVEQYRYDNRECVAARTGTYVLYSDYAAQNGLYGAHVCNPTVVLYPDRDWLVGFKHHTDAIIYLRAIRAQYEKEGKGKAKEHVTPA